MKSKFLLILTLTFCVTACTNSKEKSESIETNSNQKKTDKIYSYFEMKNKDGVITVPDNYRDWDFIGTWAIDGENGAEGIHNVYASPGAVAYHKKNNSFPDGCILVKELMDTHTQLLSTGLVSRANNGVGWFVMVKDAKNRYPDNPLWGEGWGWSFFEANNRSVTTSIDYKINCISCHVPAKKSEWIYKEGYPVLNQ